MTVKNAIIFLQAAHLQLQTTISDGRLIYRIIDKDGHVTSISSRIERVFAIALEKIN